jgi:ATP phosphoribosyltransferase regulatory subunit
MRYPEHIPGTRDYIEDEARRLLRATDACTHAFDLYGYERIILPILERSDIFLQRSGEEIRSRMYILNDPKGKEMCLRPEMTISAARAYLERMSSRRLPVRLSYQGSVFRYDKVREGRYRQFIQAGVECLGIENRIAADVEAVSLALDCMRGAGLKGFRLLIGDLELVAEFINSLPVAAPVRSRLLENFWRRNAFQLLLKRYTESPAQGKEGDDLVTRQVADALASIGDDASQMLVRQILSLFVEKEIGQRDLGEIAERFLHRFTNKGMHLPGDCLEALQEYMSIGGPPDSTLAQLEKLLRKIGASPGPAFENASRRLELLSKTEGRDADMDFQLGFRRGIEYYTGFIFEIHRDDLGPVSQICGGGRYDNLLAALGAPRQIPAIGFAIGVDRLLLALEKSASPPEPSAGESPDAVLTTIGQVEEQGICEIARICRRAGWKVRSELDRRRLSSVLSHASDENIPFAIIVGEDELRDRCVKIKDMLRREEKIVAIGDLKKFVQESVAGAKRETPPGEVLD